MSKSLVRQSQRPNTAGGLVAGVASAVIPGLGQLINGETDKAIGVFVVAAVAGAGFLASIPLIGTAAALVGGVTWLYGVADGYIQGRKP
jgi:TM2 domain-containing membrane protein YozV